MLMRVLTDTEYIPETFRAKGLYKDSSSESILRQLGVRLEYVGMAFDANWRLAPKDSVLQLVLCPKR